jgi:competence protein ComEA
LNIDSSPHSKKKRILRITAIVVSALLVLAIYLTWHSTTPTAASPTITQQAYSSLASTPKPQPASATTATTGGNGGTIQVYIVGSVKHPGVYTLPADSRVYQLIQAAGGTQPGADLVSINLAARLSDGQEIYVLSVGEAPPAYTGSSTGASASGTPTVSSGTPININTATETQMMQALHISATTAKKIIDYRTQHGPYTSVDQLAQVVSQTIYNRIKSLVTV